MLSEDDDPGFLGRLIRHFLVDTPTRLSTIGTACRQGRAEDVRRMAHSPKISAAHLGAAGMAGVCDRISLPASKEPEAVPAILRELDLEFQRARR